MFVAIISFIFLAATIALGVREARRGGITAGGAIGGGLFGAVQLFIGVWAAMGLVQDDALAAIVFGAALTACAWSRFAAVPVRERLLALVGPEGRLPHPVAAGVLILLLAGAFATLGLEIPSNHDLGWMYPLCLLLEYCLVTAALTGVYFIFQRRGSAPAVLAALLGVLGLAEYFVVLFKSMPIQPGDLFALSTAMAVSSGYVYTLSSFCLYGIALTAIAAALGALAGGLRPERAARSRRGLVVNLVVGVLCIAGIAAHATFIDYYNTLGIQIYTWRPLESYYRQGYIPSFISSAQTIIPPKPQGYDRDEAEALLDEYAGAYEDGEGAHEGRDEAVAQFDAEQPTVIAIMNETFSDLSIYQNLHAGYEGPTFFKSISDAVSRGTLYVSAFGGGTCNTEFEFLTGNSMTYLGQGVYPYTIYNLTQTQSLAQQFSDLGYDTCAIHPNHGTNWNRENVYRDFGFDDFLTIEDFQDAETLRGMVTDGATYDTILEMLEQNGNPQFIFDVTMQNHSGYTTGLIPEDKRVSYRPDGYIDPEVDEYLALIQESDRALEEFIEKLRELDRPVVVVFFGDHQPYFPSDYNDRWFTDEDEATHAERLWQTDYVIWANYDVAGCSQTSERRDTSVNYLGALMMELIGAPLTDYQQAQLAARASMPAINTTGYQDRSGAWYLTGASEDEIAAGDGDDAARTRDDLSRIQYLELFDHGGGLFTMTMQSAANETDPNLAPGTTKIK